MFICVVMTSHSTVISQATAGQLHRRERPLESRRSISRRVVVPVVILAAAASALWLDAPHEPAAFEAVEARRLPLRLLGGQKVQYVRK